MQRAPSRCHGDASYAHVLRTNTFAAACTGSDSETAGWRPEPVLERSKEWSPSAINIMVDVEVCAGGESTRRKMDALTDSAVEIIPSELYDSSRAKIAANLQWICAKAYGIDNIPEELKDPFYIDQYEQEHIKPPVIKLLLSSELYCRVCSLILKGDQVASLQGHQSVIQALSRKGIYVMESDDTPVSESDLGSAPIKMGSHMAMIDALMMAYTVEMISIEKVVASVKRFSTFSASKELPYDLEDAMVFWINKVNLKMREITEKEFKLKQQLMESPGHQKVRYRRDHPSNRQLPYFPMLEDLMKDGSDGAALLAVIHYYCPEQMKLDDICLKEVTSIADSLYNIQLLKEFSNEYLNKCFYLTLEDMLYAPLVLKPNVMVFIAELFWWFENVKPDFVQPRDIQEIKDAKTVLQQKSSRPPVPISNATKRSFMASPANTNSADLQPSIQLPPEACNRYYLHPEEAEYLGKGTPAFSPSHPLLPLRQKQQKSLQEEDSSGHRHRSNSLTRVDGQPRGSVLAWPEKKPRPLSQPTPFALHHSTSSEVDPGSGDSISLARSISKDSLASNIINLTPKHQPHAASVKTNGKSLLNNVEIEDEDEELVAIIRSDETPSHGVPELPSTSSRAPTLAATTWSPKTQSEASESKTDSFYLEPLLPAVLKPAKEKQIINKVDECGEGKQRSFITKRLNEGHLPLSRKKASSSHGDHDLNRTFTPISSSDFTTVADPSTADSMTLSDAVLEISRPLATSSLDPSAQEQSFGGFFLHAAKSDEDIASKANVNYLKGINAHVPDTTWTMVRHDSDSDLLDIEDAEQDMVMVDDHPVVAKYIGEEESAKLQEDMKLHMQLEEKRRAIEAQKKKMEALSARQRLKLGKAAFLHVVKKGKPVDVPQPLKPDHFPKEYSRHGGEDLDDVSLSSKSEEFLAKEEEREEMLIDSQEVTIAKMQENLAFAEQHKPKESAAIHEIEKSKIISAALLEDNVAEVDVNECDLSIEKLNETITVPSPSTRNGSGKENVPVEEPLRSKANLIEVDLSDLKAPDDGDLESQGSSTDIISESDQKSGVGFFFKDEQKAEDELAKKRAAFLLKQQRKAEEARLRKQQLEAEVEQKRDEARRKAEEDRIRKEEEKARRELIKQEYLRKKQQQILEEQGLGKPKSKPKKPRPKSVHREESYSDSGTKCSSTPDNLSSAQSGSSLSLASAATTEPESVHSGGTPSQRVESMESLPILSRNPSRNTERDWENASTASSIASVAEYTGPKLFKEPSSKSNKPIIHNAISHCCLAGKVNEPHKNSILEELEKCDANHYIILFRDAGCQFRALYCYYPDTEEIYKLTGTGPKSITKKMIDKLYKYSSDRKQFNVIPAKTMSVSVDALTIHNHLWQAKRPAVPKKTQTRK
ncbi:calmodulin-regulated spectrin-associated protein 1 isoform A [Alligator mississippiensis]|uniref:Calmodulin-regulated spectrin-associated protein 1 isoform A n=1 Tax=Alligator mississippiensis TaxID=8496 RepID=A0A151MFZ0_ALLMI|nr:calmodulin-regulated spectrin-associated protein 1 isoform A [Alligator mississippiensis]